MASGALDVSVDLRRRVRARCGALPAAPRPRDLVRRPGAQRDAVLARAGRGARRAARLVTRSSMTSVALLELLFENVWSAARVRARRRGDRRPRALRASAHDARLVIGDAALLLGVRCARASAASRAEYPHVYDLGAGWKRWTGLPFVFAVWVAQRTTPVEESLARARVAHRVARLGARASRRARGAGAGATGVARRVCARVSLGPRLRALVRAPRRPHRVLPPARAARAACRTARSSSFPPPDIAMRDLLDFYTTRRCSSSAPRRTACAQREASRRRRHVHRRPQHQLHERLRRRLRLLRVLPAARSTTKGRHCRTSRSARRSTRPRRSAACRS